MSASPRFAKAWWPGLVALVAANLLPLLGVLVLGWDLGLVFVLYWAESGIILAFSLVKLVMVARLRALFLVPFTLVHAGIFMLGHLLFIGAFFVRTPEDGWRQWLGELGLAWAVLFASHLVSFINNTVRRGERPKDSGSVMAGFYNRVVLMHIAILFGGFLAEAMGSPAWALGLLVALKTGADAAAHLGERRRAARGHRDEPPMDEATRRDIERALADIGGLDR